MPHNFSKIWQSVPCRPGSRTVQGCTLSLGTVSRLFVLNAYKDRLPANAELYYRMLRRPPPPVYTWFPLEITNVADP